MSQFESPAHRRRPSYENVLTGKSNNSSRRVLGELNRSGLPAPGWGNVKGQTGSAKKTIPTSGPASGHSSDSEELDEDVNVLIPTPALSMEEISNKYFGEVKERESRKNDLLKRTKPEQKLFGYPKKYVDIETKRLATGLKEHFCSRDNFIDACKDFERVALSSLESARVKVDQYRVAARDATRKVAEQDTLVRTLRMQESILKEKLAALKGESQSFRDKESGFALAKQDLEKKLQQVELQLKESQLQMEDFRHSNNKLSAQIDEYETKIQKMQLDLDESQRQKEAAIQDMQSQHMQDKSRWTSEKEAVEVKSREWQWKLEELTTRMTTMQEDSKNTEERSRQTIEENMRMKLSNESLRTQLQSMEQQAQQRDLHLNKTLETFQQNQTFSQERIAMISEEKAKVEVRFAELTNTKGKLEVENTKLSASLKEATDLNSNLSRTLQEKSEQLELVSRQLQESAQVNAVATAEIEKATRETAALKVSLEKTRAELAAEKATFSSERAELSARLERAETENKALQTKNSDLESEIQAVKTAYGQAGSSNESQLERLCEISKEAEMLKRQVTDLDRLQVELSRLRGVLKETETKLYESDKAKRQLHNEVQTLRGKVRVVARVRPGTTIESEGNPLKLPSFIQRSVDGTELSIETEQEQTSGTTIKKHQFNFDRVFAPVDKQEDVFDEVSSFVQSALDGYNVCLFSYGQTGSGKTFTMTGDHSCPTKRGIIPRSIDQIMSYQLELRSKGWEYSLEAQYLEIYNETIQDLLQSGGSSGGSKLEIRDSKKEIVVSNAKRIPIKDREDIHRVLDLAERNRSVAATDLNAHSSRSHSVFTLFINGIHREFGAQVVGSLSMCDLAGSERISRSGAAGERLKEAQAINKSLSSLAGVFSALHKKNSHVPYRNSKLTHLLQPCFAGEGKTMMIVNLSPELDDRGESVCSLRFAGQVHNTELGRAKKQIASVEK